MKPVSNPSPTLESLQQKWPNLADIDRALAIRRIRLSGISFRRLAKLLNCSEARLRYLDWAARAPSQDRFLARKGRISISELVRRAREAAKQRAAQDKRALEQKQTKAAQKAATKIYDWLEEHQLFAAHGEAIIDEARLILAKAEYFNQLPRTAPPSPGTPIANIADRMQPPASVNPDVKSVGWYADWLARWAFFAFPDSLVRDKALNIALDQQIKKRE